MAHIDVTHLIGSPMETIHSGMGVASPTNAALGDPKDRPEKGRPGLGGLTPPPGVGGLPGAFGKPKPPKSPKKNDPYSV